MFKTGRSRWSSPALFAGVIVAFLLPFGTVSCSDEQVTFTGAELALLQVPLAWKSLASLATVDIHAGYVLALLGFGAAATHHAVAARRRRRSVVAADTHEPTSRWRRGLVFGAPVLLALLLFGGWGALRGTTADSEPEYVDFDTADYDPAWAPGGREIAFVRRGAVHSVAADGSCPRRVTQGTEPAWSPDGTQLAVTRCEGDVCSVLVVSRDGSAERELVAGPFSSLAWAPDGTHVFMSRAGDDLTTTTWIVRTDGEGLRRLAPPWLPRRDRRWSIAAASEDEPTLSPDGSRYVFASSDDPRRSSSATSEVENDGSSATRRVTPGTTTQRGRPTARRSPSSGAARSR